MTTIEQEEKRFKELAIKFKKLWNWPIVLNIQCHEKQTNLTVSMVLDEHIAVIYSSASPGGDLKNCLKSANDSFEQRLNGKVE